MGAQKQLVCIGNNRKHRQKRNTVINKLKRSDGIRSARRKKTRKYSDEINRKTEMNPFDSIFFKKSHIYSLVYAR